MPHWDFKCKECGRVDTLSYENHHAKVSAVHDEGIACPTCGGDMIQLPCAPNFEIKGWSARNGYSRGL